MPTASDILEELRPLGSESYRKVMRNHGAKDPFFGVKISDLKKIQKRIKKNYELALDLFDTGNSDAMYLAGLITDDARMTPKNLQHWVELAYFPLLSECTVAWVAAESPHGWDMAMKWIDAKLEQVAAAGWATLSSLVAIKPDDELDLPALKKLLERVEKTIRKQPNRVKYTMNGFVIAVGSYVAPLTELALEIGAKLGSIEVDMQDTECKVPSIVEYIQKVQNRGSIGKKRKTAKC